MTRRWRRWKATGRIVRQQSFSPQTAPWLDYVARLRTEIAVAAHFGDLSAAKEGLAHVLALLETLSTPADPDDPTPASEP